MKIILIFLLALGIDFIFAYLLALGFSYVAKYFFGVCLTAKEVFFLWVFLLVVTPLIKLKFRSEG